MMLFVQGVLHIMAYMERLRAKGVPFLGVRYEKGQIFHQLKCMKGQGNASFRSVKRPKRARLTITLSIFPSKETYFAQRDLISSFQPCCVSSNCFAAVSFSDICFLLYNRLACTSTWVVPTNFLKLNRSDWFASNFFFAGFSCMTCLYVPQHTTLAYSYLTTPFEQCVICFS